MIKIKGLVLEYKADHFTGKDGKEVNYQYALVSYGGKVLRFSTQKDLSVSVGKEVELELELRAGQNMKATPRIV